MGHIYMNIILALMILITTEILIFLSWRRLTNIYYSNILFFDLLFIMLYPIEEVVFLLLYYLEPQFRGLWVALIVIIICTTLVIDKWLLRKQNDRTILIVDASLKKINSKRGEIIQELVEKLESSDDEKFKLLDYIESFRININKLKKEIKELKKK